MEAIDLLQNATESADYGDSTAHVVLYLLGDILNRFNSTDQEDKVQFIEVDMPFYFWVMWDESSCFQAFLDVIVSLTAFSQEEVASSF